MGRSRKAHAGLQNVGDVRDLAGSAVETVRDHATAAGESVGSAVTSALDTVAARGRGARKKAQKKARKQSRSVRSTAQSSVDGARRQSARQLRNLQSLVEIGVDKNTTVVFPAPLMSTIGELGSFLARETRDAATHGTGRESTARDVAVNGTAPNA